VNRFSGGKNDILGNLIGKGFYVSTLLIGNCAEQRSLVVDKPVFTVDSAEVVEIAGAQAGEAGEKSI
jgi:hypothetical protein